METETEAETGAETGAETEAETESSTPTVFERCQVVKQRKHLLCNAGQQLTSGSEENKLTI